MQLRGWKTGYESNSVHLTNTLTPEHCYSLCVTAEGKHSHWKAKDKSQRQGEGCLGKTQTQTAKEGKGL